MNAGEARLRDALVRWFQREGVTVQEAEGLKPFVYIGTFKRIESGRGHKQFRHEGRISLYDLAAAIADGRLE